MIYILEDDDNIRKLINYSLTSQDFEVKDFSLPSDFWSALEDRQPQLLLLDIMLPQEDGISILKKLRSNPKTSGIPVIMLTAKDSEYDIVTGLDAGADDYVTKPFGMMALVSRIKAVLRRYEKNNSQKELLQSGSLKIDENQHTVFNDNQQIFLTVKEFDLLVLLLKNRGNVLSRQQLLEHIWDISTDVESRTVDVHISSLRNRLGQWGKRIKTVRSVGYCLEA